MFLLGASGKRNHGREKNVCGEMKLTSFEYLALVRDGYLKFCYSFKIKALMIFNASYYRQPSTPRGFIRGKLSVILRIGSNPADIDRFRSHTRNFYRLL